MAPRELAGRVVVGAEADHHIQHDDGNVRVQPPPGGCGACADRYRSSGEGRPTVNSSSPKINHTVLPAACRIRHLKCLVEWRVRPDLQVADLAPDDLRLVAQGPSREETPQVALFRRQHGCQLLGPLLGCRSFLLRAEVCQVGHVPPGQPGGQQSRFLERRHNRGVRRNSVFETAAQEGIRQSASSRRQPASEPAWATSSAGGLLISTMTWCLLICLKRLECLQHHDSTHVPAQIAPPNAQALGDPHAVFGEQRADFLAGPCRRRRRSRRDPVGTTLANPRATPLRMVVPAPGPIRSSP